MIFKNTVTKGYLESQTVKLSSEDHLHTFEQFRGKN